jgi:hypothetical protein
LARVEGKIKGVGQECPSHTVKVKGKIKSNGKTKGVGLVRPTWGVPQRAVAPPANSRFLSACGGSE